MALPELIEALRAQAAERRAEVHARADAETERIRADSSASLARRKAEYVERAIRDANEVARRSLSEARSEATASILVARDRLLGRVRDALEERTRTVVGDPDYRAALAAELGAALERLPPGEVIVRTRPELAGVLARTVGGRHGITVETILDPDSDPNRGIGAGFVAVSPASGVEIDATLQTKLQHRWRQVAVSVMAEVGQ